MEAVAIRYPASPLANQVTISHGGGLNPPSRDAARFTLISLADEAPYDAKRSGRHRVSTLAQSYEGGLSGFAASQSHNRTPKLGPLSMNHLKPQ